MKIREVITLKEELIALKEENRKLQERHEEARLRQEAVEAEAFLKAKTEQGTKDQGV